MNAEDALFNREAQRQAKRIELNWKRIDEGNLEAGLHGSEHFDNASV